ncbi:MAG TPA: MXAN_6640 family putative metalloprotease, partial [Polyangiales bacterium]|nr:MXAN_6640 family putative metalloprotease [Polyangiales bacterium]
DRQGAHDRVGGRQRAGALGFPAVMRGAALLLSAACAALTCPAAAQRPDMPTSNTLPPKFGASDRVEQLDSADGKFRIHYTRTGEHAVPSADANADGVPDFVQQVAQEYAAVGAYYADQLGFEPPLSDGDGRFDVYLLDFPTSSDGEFRKEACLAAAAFRCTGYMLHENDFNGRNYPSLARATRILASHEYFHAVQNGYDADASRVLSEGTAVWASEQYDPTLSDLEGFVAGYLQHTERSLGQEPMGPFDQFSYGSALFFQYLGERYGRDVIRELWGALRDRAEAGAASNWIDALDALLRESHDSSLGDAFAEFTRWNLFTGERADAERGYARGDGYPELAAKSVSLPYTDSALRVFPLAARFYSVELSRAAPRLVLRATGDGSGVRLLLAREAAGRIVALQLSAAGAEPELALDGAASGDRVFAAVINPRLGGESARPDVCLGSPQACASAAEPDAGAEPESEREASGGCSVQRRSGSAGGLGLCVLVGLSFAARRARRTRRSPLRSRARFRSRS